MAINFNLLQAPQQGKVVANLPGQQSSGNGIGDLISGLGQFASALHKPTPAPVGTALNQLQDLSGSSAPTQTTAQNVQSAVGGNLVNPTFLPQDGHPELQAVMAGISSVESGGNYNAQSQRSKNGDRAYGKYQIMGNNIPSWSKEALGYPVTPTQFLASPELQEKVAGYQINKNLKNGYTPQDTFSIWFSGRPQKEAGNAKDIYGTTVPSYIKKANQGYLNAREQVKTASNNPRLDRPLQPPPGQNPPTIPPKLYDETVQELDKGSDYGQAKTPFGNGLNFDLLG